VVTLRNRELQLTRRRRVQVRAGHEHVVRVELAPTDD
jgi:hypothetical protein